MESWTWKVPTKPGWYWFCGLLWSRIETIPIKVIRGANSTIYIVKGSFLYPKHEECYGVWKPVISPGALMYNNKKRY